MVLQHCFQCQPDSLVNHSGSIECTAERLKPEFPNPFYGEREVIEKKICRHCWLTNNLKNPVVAFYCVMLILVSMSMCKMLCLQLCCRTSDGRYIDVAGILMGTTDEEHTARYICAVLLNREPLYSLTTKATPVFRPLRVVPNFASQC